jgi:DNA-binding NtrC family response regulator
MVVDDEQAISDVIKAGLEKNGYEIVVFNDSQKALDNYVAGKYELIITDIRMPKLNGFELYRLIVSKDPNAKIVFMSAFELVEDHIKQFAPHSYGFIRQPFRMQDLIELLKRALAS